MSSITTQEFIAKSKLLHGNKFDYSRVTYINAKTNVIIGCIIHGWFSQTPSNHTNKTHPRGCPKCGFQNMTADERFWYNVDKNDFLSDSQSTHCWSWTGYTAGNGYGMFKSGGKYVLAHRYSYTIHKGSIPDGLCVLHTCDNPECTNPNHLYVGTPMDNAKDKVSRGRSPSGEKSGRARLTWNVINEIRHLWKTGKYLQKELAIKYGVPRSHISLIVNNKTWKTDNL